jgi:hypothetical protein
MRRHLALARGHDGEKMFSGTTADALEEISNQISVNWPCKLRLETIVAVHKATSDIISVTPTIELRLFL